MIVKQYILEDCLNYDGRTISFLKLVSKFQLQARLNCIKHYILVMYNNPIYIDDVEDLLKKTFKVVSIKDLANDSNNTVSPSSDEIQYAISKLQTTAYNALFHHPNISEHAVLQMITSCEHEIRQKYKKKNKIEIHLGDIVICDMGYHLSGEISGYHIYCIVLQILSNNQVCIAPLIEYHGKEPQSHSYLFYDATRDILNSPNCYPKGFVLLGSTRVINIYRIYAIIGKTSTAFLNKVLKQLASTFDFTHKSNPKKSSIESSLMEVIGSSLTNLNSSKPSKEQILSFLSDIGMETQPLLIEAFKIACLKNIFTLKEIVEYLHENHSNFSKNQINAVLRKTFKEWISKYPNLGKYKAISLSHLIKIFVKNST